MTSLPVSERGYARPDLLAETGWLEQHLNDPALRIIDTRSPQLYEAGHVPGAVNLAAVGAIPCTPEAEMGEPEDFARLASNLGVSKDSTVVIYDAPAAAMGMLAWSFLYYGHEDVRVLDGGFTKWSGEGRTTSTSPTSYPHGDFSPSLALDLCCTLEQAKAGLGQPNTVFWDTRTDAEYEGTAPLGANTPRAGHLPGAVHLEWTELLDPDTRTLKPAATLHTLLESRGITPESEINCY